MGARIVAIICFKSILIDHRTSCDSVMKTHHRPCARFERAESKSFHRIQAYLKLFTYGDAAI